ncbi:MAG: hypothetical protein Q9164_006698, partial [Protoblastenia rupestris]
MGHIDALRILILVLIYYVVHFKNLVPQNDIQRILASWGHPNTSTAAQAQYPTSFSRDITPIPCHSHNDYWRRVPLYTALAAGCISIEADVWYTPTDLLVGHKASSLTQARTLQTLYIDPLLSILSHQNPLSTPLQTATDSSTLNGIFDTSPTTSLILLIDIKTDPLKTLPAVIAALEPLRAHDGYLTHFNGSSLISGPLTIVATGETPFDMLVSNNSTYRDIFFDAPLDTFWPASSSLSNTADQYTPENSYYASTNFEATIGKLYHGIMSPSQVELVRGQ